MGQPPRDPEIPTSFTPSALNLQISLPKPHSLTSKPGSHQLKVPATPRDYYLGSWWLGRVFQTSSPPGSLLTVNYSTVTGLPPSVPPPNQTPAAEYIAGKAPPTPIPGPGAFRSQPRGTSSRALAPGVRCFMERPAETKSGADLHHSSTGKAPNLRTPSSLPGPEEKAE